jgi:hypothetical protein
MHIRIKCYTAKLALKVCFSVNNYTNFKIFWILSIYTILDG